MVLLAGLLTGLAVPVSALAGTSPVPGGRPVAGTTYVARPGDTLWSIARRLGPPADAGTLATQMARETGSTAVVPGEHIVLP